MEKVEQFKSFPTKTADFNGNNAQFTKPKTKNGISKTVKDQVVTSDGRIFYPCQFCNKVFPIKKSRTFHLKKCSAKDYILSVEEVESQKDDVPEEPNIPPIKKTAKIDIQQNILLNKQMNVSEILANSKTPPIKLTIRRSPSNGAENSAHFTVSNSFVLKEKNESNDDFNTIAKRLESNAVSIIKQPRNNEKESAKSSSEEDSDYSSSETACRKCTKEFSSQLELLRHSRKCQSYPKVVMALSEVKKFYSSKDRSKCPICHKPLKTNFRSAFVKHLHTHTNEMKYSCHVCNKKFRRVDHMKAHEKRHIIKDKK